MIPDAARALFPFAVDPRPHPDRAPHLAALAELEREIVECRRCPRLVKHREQIARERRAAYREWTYWGRPVPGFGDPDAWLCIVGLAPAAHGANRTGRMFTGDRSGDWLYRALYRAGLANQPQATHRDDGLRLVGAYVTATVRCAPPANRPTPAEREACRTFLERELDALPHVRVFVTLGGFAYAHLLRVLRDRGVRIPRPTPAFRHGRVIPLSPPYRACIASYHPSQQNTFTGKLTERMFDAVFRTALEWRPRGHRPASG